MFSLVHYSYQTFSQLIGICIWLTELLTDAVVRGVLFRLDPKIPVAFTGTSVAFTLLRTGTGRSAFTFCCADAVISIYTVCRVVVAAAGLTV